MGTTEPETEDNDSMPASAEAGQGSMLSVDWNAWLSEHEEGFFSYASRQVRVQADVKDVVQEALMQLLRAVESGRFEGDRSGWGGYVRAAIRHLAVDRSRREDTRARYLQRLRDDMELAESEFSEPWQFASADHELQRRQVEDLLHTLAAESAEVVRLRIWEECTFQEIAEKTQTNHSTVVSRYRAALLALRKALAENPLKS